MDDRRLGLTRGVIAVIINIAVIVGLLIVLGLLFHKTHTSAGSASVRLTGTSALIWLVLTLAYLIIPKVRTGQTIGGQLVGGRPGKPTKARNCLTAPRDATGAQSAVSLAGPRRP